MNTKLFVSAAIFSITQACFAAEPLDQRIPANTKVYHTSSEQQMLALSPADWDRTSDYPTQIVRITGDISKAGATCDEVSETVNELFTKKITVNQFYYNTYVFCGYNPETGLARHLTINSYFDPVSDRAIQYYEEMKQNLEGYLIYGLPFHIEDAQGLVVSVNIMAGQKESSNEPTYFMIRRDVGNHYFASNYDMMKIMISDIKTRFYSNDKETIMAFMDKWLYPSAGIIYSYALRSANYLELDPERIFLMKDQPKVFTNLLRRTFAHYCSELPSGHCL